VRCFLCGTDCILKYNLDELQPFAAAVGKRKANELDSSDSGGSLEPATRRPASGPKPGVGSAPLPTQVKGAPALATEKSTGVQPASSGRQLSYAEATKPSGTLKPTAKGTGTAAVPAATKHAALGARLPDHPVACPGL
jgi:hypothetical protein